MDTNEYFILEDERLNLSFNLFYLFPHYASSDLISSGMPPPVLEELRCSQLPSKQKWKKFQPYWLNIKNTAYSKVTKIIVYDIFGIEDINEKTHRVFSERIASSKESLLFWLRTLLMCM